MASMVPKKTKKTKKVNLCNEEVIETASRKLEKFCFYSCMSGKLVSTIKNTCDLGHQSDFDNDKEDLEQNHKKYVFN